MNYKAFRVEFQEAVEDLEKKFNIKLKLGSISYNTIQFNSKITGTFQTEEAKKDVEDLFRMNAKGFGVDPDWYHLVVKEKSGEEFRILDINTRASKNVLNIERISDGQRFGASVNWVLGNIKNK